MKKCEQFAEHWEQLSPGGLQGRTLGGEAGPGDILHTPWLYMLSLQPNSRSKASASPRQGLSLGSGEKVEREQLFCGSQEWAQETTLKNSGLKDNPQ